MNGKLDESTIKAKFTLAEPYEFDASIDKINLDRYLGAADKPAAKPAPEISFKMRIRRSTCGAQGHQREGAPAGRRARGARPQARRGERAVNAANGRVAVAPHSAKLYEGSISGELTVDANKNSVSLKEQLQNVSIGPILRDFAGQDRLEGRGNVAMDVTTAGATVNAMKRALNGTAKVQLRDGAVKGINIGEVLRKARSALGGSPQQAQPARTRGKRKPTSPSSARASIKNGIAHNEDLDAKAPAFRLGGAGDINIPLRRSTMW